MTLEQKLQLLATTLESEPQNLRLDLPLDSLEEWDSLARISLIGMFSKSFGRKISADVLKSFVKVQDIVDEMHE
ncbi:acyl carrier protein [Aminivibrio sp.]|jgi:acyl carrier protein|uniref:acyl carrier protein n=1 Tax=Aminivibrio sp. TaxID=1872489 RepID=UPI003D98F1BF